MRLFTALWLPPDAVAALAAELPAGPPPGWRAVDPQTWHLTLAFHGEADPGVLARRLEHSVRGTPGPRLRLAGAGAFEPVRWAGVETGDDRLPALVEAAGGDVARFVPHVTVWRVRPRPGPAAEPDPQPTWGGHRGPWWTASEVLLVAGEPARRGTRFRVVHRVPLS